MTAEKRAVRWGILGCGQVAHNFAIGLRSVSDAELVAVASRSAERAKSFATIHRARRAYGDSRQMVADEKVDVVYVATPNHCHYPDAILALGAGKAVLCEKPFTLNAGQAREIVDLARSREIFCMEAMWTRFIPAIKALDRHLDTIGTPRVMTAQLGHAFEVDAKNRLFDLDRGGGATLDLGVYPVSLAVHLFGEPVGVEAEASLTPSGVDELMASVIRFSGQRMASFVVGLGFEGNNNATILGTAGRLTINAPLYCPESLGLTRFQLRDLEAEKDSIPRGSGWSFPGGSTIRRLGRMARSLLHSERRTVRAPITGNGYNYEASEVGRCLREGRTESARMPLQQTVTVMETLDAIRAAAGVVHPCDL